MRCIDCGAGMRLVEVVGDRTMMVRGFERHTFECAACRGIERRRVFTRAGRSPTGRIVRIDPDVSQANYFARDCKSGQIVLQNQNASACGNCATGWDGALLTILRPRNG